MERAMKVMKIDTNRKWISTREAARYLGVSKDWIKDRIESGVLHYSKVGNTVFLIMREVDNLIRRGAVSGRDVFMSIK